MYRVEVHEAFSSRPLPIRVLQSPYECRYHHYLCFTNEKSEAEKSKLKVTLLVSGKARI